MPILNTIADSLLSTMRDVAPVVGILVFFQFAVLRQPIPHLARFLAGIACVVIGLALFLFGLEQALFPIGRHMAQALSSPHSNPAAAPHESVSELFGYGWIYLFAAAIGFSTTIAEPALIAVAEKAAAVSRGGIRPWGLRIAVAIGVAIGVALGAYRIVTGFPLAYLIAMGYALVILQTFFAPKEFIPLAYDSGGVTTSTVTVPIVTALGLGLSASIPGRNPALDGFGLIALASLFPIISVMGYAQIGFWWTRKKSQPQEGGTDE
jgi:hypothetical protein